MEIRVGREIKEVCPDFVGACLEAVVTNSAHSDALWAEIAEWGEKYRERVTTTTLKQLSPIAATRRVYRACGKDPSRYRPAAEALIRRLLQGKVLHEVNTLVDLINLASIAYGYSIGGFDADRIRGGMLTLGVGQADEPFEGIGRGVVNIEGLPVYRDEEGGIGTPTTDHERTKIRPDTSRLLVLINGYDGDEAKVRENAEYIRQLLRKYAGSDGGSFFIYR